MLAREREQWQRDQESQATAIERERSQHIAETTLLQRYTGVLICKMRGQRMHMPSMPTIPSRDPSIRRHELEYILVPPGPVGGWGFAPI